MPSVEHAANLVNDLYSKYLVTFAVQIRDKNGNILQEAAAILPKENTDPSISMVRRMLASNLEGKAPARNNDWLGGAIQEVRG